MCCVSCATLNCCNWQLQAPDLAAGAVSSCMQDSSGCVVRWDTGRTPACCSCRSIAPAELRHQHRCRTSRRHMPFCGGACVYMPCILMVTWALAYGGCQMSQAMDIVGQVSPDLSTAGQLRLMQWVCGYQQTLRGLGVQEVRPNCNGN